MIIDIRLGQLIEKKNHIEKKGKNSIHQILNDEIKINNFKNDKKKTKINPR